MTAALPLLFVTSAAVAAAASALGLVPPVGFEELSPLDWTLPPFVARPAGGETRHGLFSTHSFFVEQPASWGRQEERNFLKVVRCLGTACPGIHPALLVLGRPLAARTMGIARP